VLKHVKVKVKVTPQQAARAQGGSGKVKAPDFLDVWHYEGGWMSASRTDRLHPQGKSLVLIFRGWVDPRTHGSVGSYGKNSQCDTTGNRPTSSAVP
jgi:hypothetical protein